MTSAARDRTHNPAGNDDFMTIDERVIPALLLHFRPRGKVWEPAAGQGHMVRALKAARFAVVASDIRKHDGFELDAGADFLACAAMPKRVQTIITNPPNSANFEFAEKAIALTKPVQGMVAIYQRHEWDTNKNTAALFDHPAYAFKITCRFRPRWFDPKPGEKTSSPFHRWSWYCFDWSSIGYPPVQRFA